MIRVTGSFKYGEILLSFKEDGGEVMTSKLVKDKTCSIEEKTAIHLAEGNRSIILEELKRENSEPTYR